MLKARTQLCILAALAIPLTCGQEKASDVEFFEKQIRPILNRRCLPCHSENTVASGGLRLDDRPAIIKGGNRGSAIDLIPRATTYTDPDLRMPPQGKLPDAEIAKLREWIDQGAPHPNYKTNPPGIDSKAPPSKQTQSPWALQPIRTHPQPKVRNRAWAKTWIDSFILSKLEANQLRPAPPADKRTLLRRVTFDLTGLPPTPADIAAFVNDSSPVAYEKVVDRLLASPHYGERWARHWLDLARYAETTGHEFDYEKPNAWRYRDYVIRALNEDLPYNQFIREQLAGDLLRKRAWDTPAATAFLALGEERNAADDLAEVRAEKIDNQIDTISKTFLGLTVACARCHDHKFDPIPTRDYYAIAGILNSTQIIQASLDPPSHATASEPETQPSPDSIANLRAALDLYTKDGTATDPVVKTWLEELKVAAAEPDHLLYPIAALAKNFDVEKVRSTLREWTEKSAPSHPLHRERGDLLIADFRKGHEGFRIEGPAFGSHSNELTGYLTSKTFRANGKYFHVRLHGVSDNAGRRGPQPLRVSLIGDGRDVTITPDPGGRMKWRMSGMDKMPGELAFLEIVDRTKTGHLYVEQVFLSNSKDPPYLNRKPDPRILQLFDGSGPASMEALITSYANLPNPVTIEVPRSAAQQPDPRYALIAADDTPRNLRLHIAGNHRNLGDEIPRGALSILPIKEDFSQGSGRAQLAEVLVNPANPLTARVIVNRIWKHHFGEGIVRSVDNFGLMGERPSHPELLDTLAARFIEDGWSLKKLHRTLVLSATYRTSSAGGTSRLLQHMPIRRLEAESLRDAILAVSGSLDRTLYGEPVPPYISEYQDGRGKPQSGPLDGAGRRSIYLGVRRNFLLPMFLAFDYPMTVSTIGRRGNSTVPSQALTLMNNEFVAKQAALWAERTANEPARQRVEHMFESAFARKPEPLELDQSLTFAAKQSWADLAHALINAKEFLFIR